MSSFVKGVKEGVSSIKAACEIPQQKEKREQKRAELAIVEEELSALSLYDVKAASDRLPLLESQVIHVFEDTLHLPRASSLKMHPSSPDIFS